MRILLAVGATLVLALSSLALGCNLDSGTVGVPVEVTNADRVGAIAFNLIYDESVLEAQEVVVKELARGANARYSTAEPGKLVVVIEYATNINGDGTLVEARFRVLDPAGSTVFRIELLDDPLRQDTGEPVETTVLDGSYSGPQNSVQSPTIVFGR